VIKETITVDNETVEIRKPGTKLLQMSQMQYNIKLASLIKQAATSQESTLLSKTQLDKYLKQIGVWTEEDQMSVFRLQTEIIDLETKLKKGGIKLIDAKRIAIDTMIKRQALLTLVTKRSQYEELTIESLAEQHRFNFIMINSVFSQDNTLFYKDLCDYEDKESDEITCECAKILASWLFGYDINMEQNFTENQFLKKYKFVNDDGALVNKDGNVVDINNNIIKKDNEITVKPFLDEEGKEVIV